MALMDWNIDAGTSPPARLRSTMRSVSRFRELPACSKSAQKRIDPKIRNMAAKIRLRSTAVRVATAVQIT